MLRINEKQSKIISVIISVLFIGSVVAIALTQSGNSVNAAASGGNVGVIDSRQVMSQHPDLPELEKQMQAAVEEVKKDFEEKSAGMNDQEKADYYGQSQERLRNKQQELLEPLDNSIKAAVKATADKKGLGVVIEKGAVVYGGVDITADVVKNLAKK